jgi:hypothetical protein
MRRINRRGDLRYIGHYLQVMIKTAANRPALTVQCFAHRQTPMLHLFFARGGLHAMCLLKGSEPQLEQTVRAIFAEPGVTLVQDEIAGNVRDASRFLLYRLPSNAPEATRLVCTFFQRGYDLVDNTELEFTYRERGG